MKRFLSRAFTRCGRWLDAGSRVCLYASAALTPLDQMRKDIGAGWNDFAADEHEIGGGLALWEKTVADRYVRAGDRILVVGCGSGRDVVAFLQRGCIVTGIDPAERAISRAGDYLKKHGGEAVLECGFFEDWQRDEVFDVVWFSWFVYGYVPDATRRIRMLKQAARHVSSAGCVIVSYPTNPPVSRANALGRLVQRVCGGDWTLDEGDVIGQIAGTDLLTYEHRFTRAQIEQETDAAGFRPVLFADPIVVLTRG